MDTLVRYITDASLKKMKEKLDSVSDLYQKETFDLSPYETFVSTVYHYKNGADFPELEIPSKEKPLWQTDCQNGIKLYNFFFIHNKFPVSLLFDERYMAYLIHTTYWKYTVQRWDIANMKGNKTERIKNRFFYGRAPYARNAVFSLVWPIYLIQVDAELNDFQKNECIKCYFEKRDTVDRILERNFSRNPVLLTNCLLAILSLPKEAKLGTNIRSRMVGKKINNVLSSNYLDSLTREESLEIIKELVKDVASGVYDNEKADKSDAEEED